MTDEGEISSAEKRTAASGEETRVASEVGE